jgi:hypothetical protein
MMNDLASIIHRFGNNPALSDEAAKGFAHLQAKLFKVGEDNLSRWKDMEKLFGGLNTPAKRAAMQESLVAYKQAVELNPAAKFWIKNIDDIQPEAYRYSSFTPPNGWSSYNGSFPDLADPWYCSFDKINTPELANDILLLPSTSRNPRYRFEFDTVHVREKSRAPTGYGEQLFDPHFEPITRDIPPESNPFVSAGTGRGGGGSQFLVQGEFPVKKVVDMQTNQQVWP